MLGTLTHGDASTAPATQALPFLIIFLHLLGPRSQEAVMEARSSMDWPFPGR